MWLFSGQIMQISMLNSCLGVKKKAEWEVEIAPKLQQTVAPEPSSGFLYIESENG